MACIWAVVCSVWESRRWPSSKELVMAPVLVLVQPLQVIAGRAGLLKWIN
jgi:hypothetical protein